MILTKENFCAMYMDWLTPNTVVLGFLLTVGTFRNSFALYLYIFVFPTPMKDFSFPTLKSEYVRVFMGRTLIMILNFYCADFSSTKLCKVMHYFSRG